MPSLKAPPANWQEAILNSARMFMNADICFYREIAPDEPYNPVTGQGGDGGIAVYWRGKARVQHLRAPREFSTGYQAEATRFFRFQVDPIDTWNGNSLPFLPQGVKARVLAGGRDSHLESLAFVANSAINSSHMAVRTVELSSNMTPVEWQWTPDVPPTDLFPSDGLYPSYALYPIG